MSGLLDDLRHAMRQLRLSPGFAALAVITLALAIGANTAMFTVAEDVLLRPLPYADASLLTMINPSSENRPQASSWLNYRDVRDQATRSFSEVALFSEDVGVLSGPSSGERNGAQGNVAPTSVVSPNVSPNLFAMLGVRPLLGRTFTAQEGDANGPKVVLLSEGLWREAFHANPAIVGETIRVNNQARTVVGVMPAAFRFPESMGNDIRKGVWLPLQPTPLMLNDRGYHFEYIVGKLRPGVTLAQAQAELDGTTRSMKAANPKKLHADFQLQAIPYLETVTGQVRPVFLGLVAALGMVLLIACANVANLMIARCLGRQQEFAVRSAMGAPRGRLIRGMLVEGGVLSALGCAFGIALAWLLIRAIRTLPADPSKPTVKPVPYVGVQFVAIPEFQGIGTAVGQQFSAALAGQLSVDQALQSAQQLTTREMTKAGYIK